MELYIVDDEACPRCGQATTPKVGDDQGRWWWKCLDADCTVGYWLPETGEIEERLSPEEARESDARIKAEVDAMMVGMRWVRTDDGSRPGIESWGMVPE